MSKGVVAGWGSGPRIVHDQTAPAIFSGTSITWLDRNQCRPPLRLK